MKQIDNHFTKKIRISNKNGIRILRGLQTSPSPNKQVPNYDKKINHSVKIQDIKFTNQHKKLPLHSNHEDAMHSYRYRLQSFQNNQRCTNNQPVDQMSTQKQYIKKPQYLKQFFRRARGAKQITHRSTDKSPYLQKKINNKSQRKLIVSSRNLSDQGRNLYKHLRPVRFDSLEERSSSMQMKKSKDDQDVIKQAKKYMLAGQSRKSMLVLRQILLKDPLNTNALYISAINLYNIGDYGKSAEYIDTLLKLKINFNINAFFIRSKIYLRQNDLTKCLQKLDQCLQIFPNSPELFIERAQIMASLHKYKSAIQNFQQVLKISPKNALVKQKMISMYEHLSQYQKIIQLVDDLCKQNPQYDGKYNFIKCKSLHKLCRFDEILKLYNNTSDISILYFVGFALYKKQDFLKSYLALQSSLSSQSQQCELSIILMLTILCKQHNFYEAYHLIQRCQHLNVNKQRLNQQFRFVEGTICIMKRNIYEGIQKLNKVINELPNSKTKQNQNQFLKYLTSQIHSFIAYAYFCIGDFQKCKINYEIQEQKYPNQTFSGSAYNINLNKALLHYQKGEIQESFKIFQFLCQLNPKKLQPHICLSILYVNMYFKHYKQNYQMVNNNLEIAKQLTKICAQLVNNNHNNVGANVYYHKSVLHGALQQWKQAIISIDQALQKSQQNYWKYFYTRASILACIHNFSQAINDCTAAINLKQTQPFPYLLRSCCFQIQGEGNPAFKDLQTYISLKPQDKEIHKFAGKLLFENGAFQDAISAFSHQQIPQTLENEDVFLTKSKTYFLLGRFIEASQQMTKVNKINCMRKQALFDSSMMMLLDKMFSPNVRYELLIEQLNTRYRQTDNQFIKHQIFKKTQKHTLKAVCYFYLNRFNEAIQQLEQAIVSKQKTVMKQSLIQGSTRQDEKDTKLYVSQMNFNISLCYLMLGELQKGKQFMQKLQFYSNDIFYEPYRKFMNTLYIEHKSILGSENQIQTKIQIFPSRNKISNFLKEVPISIHNRTIYSRLCIPFPKVQPPQIFPKFDINLLKQFSIQKIQRKPEAPWICRQENSIMFTDKIQKYSRLQVQQSATEKSLASKDIQSSHMSVQSIKSRISKKSATQFSKINNDKNQNYDRYEKSSKYRQKKANKLTQRR